MYTDLANSVVIRSQAIQPEAAKGHFKRCWFCLWPLRQCIEV